MSGIYTDGKVLLTSNRIGLDVQSYSHELECVLAVINNGSLGRGVNASSCYWASDAHAKAVQLVIDHAQKVASAIADQQWKDATHESGTE